MSTVSTSQPKAEAHTHLILQSDLKLAMQKLAKQNRRSMNQEFHVAAARHIYMSLGERNS